MPKAPVTISVLPTAQDSKLTWRYTTQKPADDWFKPGFDDSGWKQGNAGFGTRETPGAVVRTVWNTPTIWLRREFEMPAGRFSDLQLRMHHDEDAQVYINGVLAGSVEGYTTDYETVPLTPAGKSAVKAGRNIIAVQCRQTGGGQYIDVGFVDVVPAAGSK
jgi:hypothetical protein